MSKIFNFSNHWENCFFDHYKFKSLFDYISDKETQKYYSLTWLKHNKLDKKDKSTIDEITDSFSNEITETSRKICNQMIVSLYSHFEAITEDIAKVIFINYPDNILKYIKVYSDYEASLQFSLQEFIRIEDKEEYLEILSERLSGTITSGIPEKSIDRLNCIIPLKLDREKTIILNDIHDIRNRIIHENKVFDIDFTKLDTYYTAVSYYLEESARTLHNNNIKIIDNGNLLNLIKK
ncbi:MAG: HEPN domain-containing protein [Candidatus Delongbacteria bacterium]|jgi:hypothetical protein|nr:HEPN domain-containing protein [Candidatus Delongbacteria bacterium]